MTSALLRGRYNNPEAVWCASTSDDHAVGVVVHGIRGQGGGDVPARAALDVIQHSIIEDTSGDWSSKHDARFRAKVASTLDDVEERLRRTSAQEARGQMAVIFVALVIGDGRARIAHIGDCRAYRWRGEVLEQLTEDHTLDGVVPAVLTRAVGFDTPVERTAAFRDEPVQDEDLFLLCSRGLWSQLTAEAIAGCLARSHTAEESCAALRSALSERDMDRDVAMIVARATS
jgi:serine/threonine protein phosphatase PrpC